VSAVADAGRDILSATPESVLTGRTVEPVASDGG
jgi:hypothetical protein